MLGSWQPLCFLTLFSAFSSTHLVEAYRESRFGSHGSTNALNKKLLPRAPGDGGVGNDVKWTGWTAGDGVTNGLDSDGIWTVKTAIQSYLTRWPNPEDRVGIFWAGGATSADDFSDIDEFVELFTADKGKRFLNVWNINDLTRMGLDENNKDGRWWRAINRASKALAAAASGGTAYIFLNNNNCRNLFSPPSQNPQDMDPSQNGQATNGEIWYYAELPTLMRNVNINKIVTFYKTKRTATNRPRFVQVNAWVLNNDTTKPRTFVQDIAMDATPIILPQEAGRPPLKRDLISYRSPQPASQDPVLVDALRGLAATGLSQTSNYTTQSSNSTATYRGAVPLGTGSSSNSTFTSSTGPSSTASQSSPTATSTNLAGILPSPAPTTAPPTLIAAVGIEASSSASFLSSSLVAIAPIWLAFVDNPDKPKATDLMNKINGLENFASEFAIKIGPPPAGTEKSCSVSANPIADIFNAAKCLKDGLNKAIKDIGDAVEDGFSDLTDIKVDLTDVESLEDALKNDKEDPDQKSQKSDNQSQSSDKQSSQSTTSSPTSSTTSSSQCSITRTASDCQVSCPASPNSSPTGQNCSTTCYSTVTGCSVSNIVTTVSASGGACPYIPGVSSSIPADPVPAGPYVPAWFDNGISCFGSNCAAFATGNLGLVPPTAGAPYSVNATVTGVNTAPTAAAAPTAASSSSNATAATITTAALSTGASVSINTTVTSSNTTTASLTSAPLPVNTTVTSLNNTASTTSTLLASPTGSNSSTLSLTPATSSYNASVFTSSSPSSVLPSTISASPTTLSAAPSPPFDPSQTTTSCDATFGNVPGATPTAAPRHDVDAITQGIDFFCAPLQPFNVTKGQPFSLNFQLPPAPGPTVIYQVAIEADPRPECSNAPAPGIMGGGARKPDPNCALLLTDILNGCDSADGQDKRGGRLFVNCAIYDLTAFIPPPGFEPVILIGGGVGGVSKRSAYDDDDGGDHRQYYYNETETASSEPLTLPTTTEVTKKQHLGRRFRDWA